MPARRTLLVILTLGLLTSSILAVVPAAAATGTYLRLAQLSPDTESTDLHVTSVADPDRQFVVPGVDYGEVTDYRRIDPDIYTVSVREAGAAADSPPMLRTTFTAAAGAAYTVSGLGASDAPDDGGAALEILTDDLTPPPAGRSRLRVVHAVASMPRLDVGIDGGPTVADDVAFGEATGYRSLPAGPATLQVAAPGAPTTSLAVDLLTDSVHTALVVDIDGELQVELSTDARGPGAVPVGPMETGLGGTAGERGPSTVALLLISAGLAGALVAQPGVRRRFTR